MDKSSIWLKIKVSKSFQKFSISNPVEFRKDAAKHQFKWFQIQYAESCPWKQKFNLDEIVIHEKYALETKERYRTDPLLSPTLFSTFPFKGWFSFCNVSLRPFFSSDHTMLSIFLLYTTLQSTIPHFVRRGYIEMLQAWT